MDEDDKILCASCGNFLLDELAVRIEGVHLYKERGSSHDWTTIQTLKPYDEYSSFLCLKCANEAMEEIAGACD